MGVTPLMAAAGIGTRGQAGVLGPGPPADVEARSMETMDILLKAGADVNARISDTNSLTARIARASTMTNREGQTILFFAAQSGRAAVVRFLLAHGADVNAMGDSGRSLLNTARTNAERSKLEAAKPNAEQSVLDAARANAEIEGMIRAKMPKDAGQ